MTPPFIPLATYRLQFNAKFTFKEAAAQVPYLHALGITHCYASPYLKARAGSTHGYDIVDHGALNPELGSAEDFAEFTAALRAHGMGQVLDIVPNHMGVGGNDNAWWLDVLENGQASAYASYFDIEWRPNKEEMRAKVLLPVLGDHYGTVLDQGELKLQFDDERGEFSVSYYQHRFPIDPATYPLPLMHGLEPLGNALGASAPALLELRNIIAAFEHIPPRTALADAHTEERQRDKDIAKRRLAQLCAEAPPIREHIDTVLTSFNTADGPNGGFNRLHELLQAQAYRLSYWQTAAAEINYRRFFDINELAGLRMENPAVFAATHSFILDLIGAGTVHGLRIDHPDGLHDPLSYCTRLAQEVALRRPATDDANAPPIYMLVEKILASHEHLAPDWQVHGTTGYDYANMVNGLLIDPDSAEPLDGIYTRFLGRKIDYDELVYERKKLVMQVQLASELTVLAHLLNRLSESNRHTRDFTLSGLSEALTEVIACFPVYRTYITADRLSDDDRRHIDWAIAKAKRRSPAADITIFDFLRDILLLQGWTDRQQAAQFTLKFQQYTGPVMAKAVEDTCFYIYNRLVSVNEVGGDPRHFGVSITAFHRANQERMRRWPHAMLATATHDTKRGEDTRARISVLSEMPEAWRTHVMRWSRLNRGKKILVDGVLAPGRNDEFLFYQTLLGACPYTIMNDDDLARLRERLQRYMEKAIKEAKVHTSWINPNHEYETAVKGFIDKLLGKLTHNAFLADFIPWQQRVARYGALNSLTQTLLKLTAPGVPDIYQGTELWDFHLVDPDNRRPVDYARRQEALDQLQALVATAQDLSAQVSALVDTLEDARAKLYLVWRTLQLRCEEMALFQHGDYIPITATGARAEHICAFARSDAAKSVIVAAPRWWVRLLPDVEEIQLKTISWQDTRLPLPPEIKSGGYINLLTRTAVSVRTHEGVQTLAADELFADFPVALLYSN